MFKSNIKTTKVLSDFNCGVVVLRKILERSPEIFQVTRGYIEWCRKQKPSRK